VAKAQARWTVDNARSQRELQRELAEQIVKVLRGNPALANTAEYQRIVEAIAQYTLAQAEAR
jgi:Trp operon repressor